MKKRVSLLVLSLMATGALAQDVLEEEEIPEVRRYTVEMIIFSYEQNVSAGSEIFVPDAPPPVEVLDFDVLMNSGLSSELPEVMDEPELEPEIIEELTEEEASEEEDKYELLMLPEEDFTLLDIIDRLDNLDAYTPLLHFGWTQAMYPEVEAEARPLSSFITPPEGLEGDLSLYLSRYLHLAVKLQLDAPVADLPQDPYDAYEDTREYSRDYRVDDAYNDEYVESYPVRYRIDEDRIFRNGDLRYFDHPKFGVLAKITRVEEEDPSEEELLDETELLGYDGE